MINSLDYIKLKKIILKNYKNKRICVEVKGIVSTRFFLYDTKIILNKNKLILADDDREFELEFLMMKKIKLNEKYRVELIYEDFTAILEL